jgi:hypothetical protein
MKRYEIASFIRDARSVQQRPNRGTEHAQRSARAHT